MAVTDAGDADPAGIEAPLPGAASQAWLAAILEATPDAIIAVADDGTIVSANAQAERLFGYERHELIGQPVDLLLPERLRPGHMVDRRAFAAAPHTRLTGAGLDPVARRKDGQEIPVEIGLSPLPTPEGLFVVSAIRDVSGRREAEQERSRLAAMVEASTDAIIGTTPEGIVTSWNPAAERLYGYSAAEAIGRPPAMLMPADRAGELSWILASIRRGETIDNLETVRQMKDGRLADVALTISPVRSRAGEVIGSAAIARDITARKRAEAALRESEQRFRSAFDAAAIGMALVALDGRFLQVNRSLCQIVGYREDELLGLTFQGITHPDDLQADLDLVRQLLAGEIPNYSLAKRYVHRDGRIVWVLLSVSLVRADDGQPRYFVSQIQDVTLSREAEHLKDEFISMVSHELRTPLTSISGYVDLLLDGAGGALSGPAEHYLTIVQQNGRRLVALVNDLLDMSRIDAGRIDPRREEVDLAAQLHEVAAALAPEIAAKRQSLRLDLLPGLPPIWADPQRSAQIFTNLIGNACKYTPEGGAIVVSASPMVDAVQIDVADTGIGIAAEDQERLFSRFFRADDAATRKERGTGLGLAITRALVELHGGTIAVHSAPGQGSTFSVLLPVRQGLAAQQPAAIARAAPLAAAPRQPSPRLV